MINFPDLTIKLKHAINNKIALKAILTTSRAILTTAFSNGTTVNDLLIEHSQLIDAVLIALWQHFSLNLDNLCLIAIGGYGRNELFPYSDIDLLLLYQQPLSLKEKQSVSKLITLAWDIGLKISHSTRSILSCLKHAKNDVTVYTNLLEMRYLAGNELLQQALQNKIFKKIDVNSINFFKAKEVEKQQRYTKYNQSTYCLEPDLKNSSGGLRDLHHSRWLCLYYYHSANLECLLHYKILNKKDLEKLHASFAFLSWCRFALHCLNLKDENRLFFDKQLLLAQHYGLPINNKTDAISAFMKIYFSHSKQIIAIQEIIVQHFYEKFILPGSSTVSLDNDFELSGNLINFKAHCKIKHHPDLLLKIFVLLGKTHAAEGLGAKTLCKIRANLYLINNNFRSNPRHQQLFIAIFKQPRMVFNVLQLMNRHQVLGRYLQTFDRIIGQTQYDLFHSYPVDQHTLYLLQKIDTLQQTDPFYHQLFITNVKPEILYLAGLFHDIGKGTKTDHSIYGAKIVDAFTKAHKLDNKSSKLISWLVKHHLLMSEVAQKKDIYNSVVISQFAKKIKNIEQLTYLYLLTVADIQATNENLWNSWKDSLLKHLYLSTENYFKAAIPNLSIKKQIKLKQIHVLKILNPSHSQRLNIFSLWNTFGEDYFEKESDSAIAWHTENLLKLYPVTSHSLVCIRNYKEHGATEIFIYHKNRDNLFSQLVTLIDKLNLTIVQARIFTSLNGYSLDTFSVLNLNGQIVDNPNQINEISHFIQYQLSQLDLHFNIPKRRIPSQLAHFTATHAMTKTQIHFRQLPDNAMTLLTITTQDRPGLLARIGAAFEEFKIRVHKAQIVTLGAKAEDMFYISDNENKSFKNRQQQIKLRERILLYLK